MRIDGKQQLPSFHGLQARDASNNKPLASTGPSGSVNTKPAIQAQLSDSSRELVNRLQGVVETRSERVEAVKQQLQDGLYDGPNVAQRTASAILNQLDQA